MTAPIPMVAVAGDRGTNDTTVIANTRSVKYPSQNKEAEAMMNSIPPTGWGDVATRNDLTANAVLLQGEMAEVRGEMAELRGEMAQLRADFEGFVAETGAEFAAVRADMALRQSQTNRTIVLAALATAASSWAAMISIVWGPGRVSQVGQESRQKPIERGITMMGAPVSAHPASRAAVIAARYST